MNVTVVRCSKEIHLFSNASDDLNQTIRTIIMALSKKLIGCIGKCSLGITLRELDLITDHIQRTLIHCKGKLIFREFLRQGNRIDDLACLNFYEKICEYIEDDETYLCSTTEPTLTTLTASVEEALDVAADLNGIPEIDMALLERYGECLANPCRNSMLDVLTETKYRLAEHLENAHRDFKIHLLKPCPKNK